MHYKTMVLELLQQYPEVHDRLRKQRMLLPALDRYATGLKARHTAWTEALALANPGSSETQLASEALEIALRELVDHFDAGAPPDPDEPPSIEGAMVFLRRHLPTA